MSMTPGPILFSGASGILGRALRNALEAEGARTIQLVRRAPAQPDELQWEPQTGDVRGDASALGGIAAAIHLSGANVSAHRWTPAYSREIVASRVDSTRALASMLARMERPPAVLLVASATGIYGDRGDEVLDEDSGPGGGFLAHVCEAWEHAAEPARRAGIRVVHLRLGVVLTRGGGALGKMAPVFRLGLGGPLGSGRQWMSWISETDVLGAVRFLLINPGLSGAFNLCAPNPVRNAEFARALGQQLHRPAVLPAPAFLLRFALGQMAQEVLFSSARVLPRRLLEEGFAFQHPTIAEALRSTLG